MVAIQDLTGIKKEKRKCIVKCLDELLTFKEGSGLISPIISGYNWYNKLFNFDRAVAFSNIHSSENYKEDMLKDLVKLGYDKEDLLQNFRDKGAAYFWYTFYNIREEDYSLIKDLSIKDFEKGQFLKLNEFGATLEDNPFDIKHSKSLIGFDNSWEININFNTEEKLLLLADLFMRKAGFYPYDKNGKQKQESPFEREIRKPWRDPFKMPIIIIGNEAVKYAYKLKQFEKAIRIFLQENDNEISFVIHNHYKVLKNTPHYNQLLGWRFKEELCLANKPFLISVDEIR